MRIRMRRLAGFAVAGAFLAAGVPAHAEQIRVLSSVALKTVVDALVPEFERSTKHTVASSFGLAGAIKTGIEKGEPFDVAILTPALLDELAAKGLIDASRPVVARTGLGFMIKAGAPKPDVSSVDAFRRTVLGARAIAYVSAGASGAAFVATLEKLGIAREVTARAKVVPSVDEVGALITAGTADLAVLPVSEILPVAGTELGGVFPRDIQTFIVMGAGVNGRSPRAAAAREFVAFLTSEKNTPVVRAKGMDR